MSSAEQTLLSIEDLSVTYRTRDRDVPAVREVSLSVGRGGVPQPASVPRISAAARDSPLRGRRVARHRPTERDRKDEDDMTLLILEALGAGLLLVGIVWWTMFSGRRGGERRRDEPPSQD